MSRRASFTLTLAPPSPPGTDTYTSAPQALPDLPPDAVAVVTVQWTADDNDAVDWVLEVSNDGVTYRPFATFTFDPLFPRLTVSKHSTRILTTLHAYKWLRMYATADGGDVDWSISALVTFTWEDRR